MDMDLFCNSLTNNYPPPDMNIYLQALWYDAKGDWERSHQLIQDVNGPTAARIHAYLHRKEGDEGNARYWYIKAGIGSPKEVLEEEWMRLLKELL